MDVQQKNHTALSKEIKLLKACLVTLFILFLLLSAIVYKQNREINILTDSLCDYEPAISHAHDIEALKQEISYLQDRIIDMESSVDDLQNDTADLQRDQFYNSILRDPFLR